jgi:hypothetical protein
MSSLDVIVDQQVTVNYIDANRTWPEYDSIGPLFVSIANDRLVFLNGWNLPQ